MADTQLNRGNKERLQADTTARALADDILESLQRIRDLLSIVLGV